MWNRMWHFWLKLADEPHPWPRQLPSRWCFPPTPKRPPSCSTVPTNHESDHESSLACCRCNCSGICNVWKPGNASRVGWRDVVTVPLQPLPPLFLSLLTEVACKISSHKLLVWCPPFHRVNFECSDPNPSPRLQGFKGHLSICIWWSAHLTDSIPPSDGCLV